MPLSEGEVGIRKLAEIGYKEPLIIEREASGDRIGDIERGKKLLEEILTELLYSLAAKFSGFENCCFFLCYVLL